MNIKTCTIILMLAIMGISGLGRSYASSLVVCSDVDKAYIFPDQVMLSQDGIFIFVEGESVRVPAIFQDDSGIYYLIPSIYWSCKRCGYGKNPAWTNYCQRCSRHYNDTSEDDDPSGG